MIDLDRLKAILLTSGLQKKDNNLYQVISQLLEAVRIFQTTVLGSSGGGGGIVGAGPFLTWTPDLVSLPNSRNLVAGSGITFDDTVFGIRTVDAQGREWSVLTNGDLSFPELVFAGGDVIMLHIP